jgi:hypothetical protein
MPSLFEERDQQQQRIDDLHLENLQLQKELLRYKKATYGPRADRLSENELAQATVLLAKELSATGHPKLDCIHERKQDRGKPRSSSCEKYSSKGHSRIVEHTLPNIRTWAPSSVFCLVTSGAIRAALSPFFRIGRSIMDGFGRQL